MNRPTPGPWVVDPKCLSEVQTADLQTIATCWHEFSEGREIIVTGTYPATLEESAANARLIAACPTLYGYVKARAAAGDREALKIVEGIHAEGRSS